MQIIAVRHGKTESNEQSIILGHSKIPILETSKRELVTLAKRIPALEYDAVYSSDLPRALQSAEIIVTQLGISKPIQQRGELREVNYGELTGKPKKIVRNEHPAYHKSVEFEHPRGESFQQLYDRLIPFIKDLEKEHDAVLLVTHAGCLRALYSFYTRTPFEHCVQMPIQQDTILLCTVNENLRTAKFL